jgi:hypothetical protein
MKKMKERVDTLVDSEKPNRPFMKIELKQKIKEIKQLNKK